MRKQVIVAVALATAATVAVPAVALADGGNSNYPINCQVNYWSNSSTIKSGKTYSTVLTMQGLAMPNTAPGPVTATLGVEISGAPAAFEVVFGDLQTGVTPITVFDPGPVRFVPPSDQLDSASFTFTGNLPLSAPNTTPVTIEWKSLNGKTVTLTEADLNLVYANGSGATCTPSGQSGG